MGFNRKRRIYLSLQTRYFETMNTNETSINYQNELSRVAGYSVYRGVVLQTVIGGWIVLTRKCLTKEQVDKIIDERLQEVENSIVG